MREDKRSPPDDPTNAEPEDSVEPVRSRLSRSPGLLLKRSPLRAPEPVEPEPSIIVDDDLRDDPAEREARFERGESDELDEHHDEHHDDDHDDDDWDDEARRDGERDDEERDEDRDDEDRDDEARDDEDRDDEARDDEDRDDEARDDEVVEQADESAARAHEDGRAAYTSAAAAIPRERFVYQEWKPPPRAPRSARADRADRPDRADNDDDDDFAAIVRRKRRRINLYVIFACTVIVFAGYGLGNLGGSSSPSDPTKDPALVDGAPVDGALVDGALVLAETQPDATGDTDLPADASPPDATDSTLDVADSAPDGALALADLPPPRPVIIPAPRPPDSPAVLTTIDEALADLDARRWAEAKAAYDAILERTPGHPRALYGRARASAGMKQFEDIVTDLEALFKTDPDHPQALLLAGSATRELGRAKDARRYYVRYLEAWPKTARAEEVRALLNGL